MCWVAKEWELHTKGTRNLTPQLTGKDKPSLLCAFKSVRIRIWNTAFLWGEKGQLSQTLGRRPLMSILPTAFLTTLSPLPKQQPQRKISHQITPLPLIHTLRCTSELICWGEVSLWGVGEYQKGRGQWDFVAHKSPNSVFCLYSGDLHGCLPLQRALAWHNT